MVSESERRSSEARQVLGSKIYREAYDEIERKLVNQLAMAELERERAEYLRTLLVAHRKIKQYMEQVIATGEMESLQQKRGWLGRA